MAAVMPAFVVMVMAWSVGLRSRLPGVAVPGRFPAVVFIGSLVVSFRLPERRAVLWDRLFGPVCLFKL